MKKIFEEWRHFLEDTNELLAEGKRWEYSALKGLKLIRYGGLSPRKQKNDAKPDGVSSGLWAFIYPHWDSWFLSGGTQPPGAFTRQGKMSQKRNVFFYKGPLFVRFEPEKGYKWDDNWYVMNTIDAEENLNKLYSGLLKQVRKSSIEEPSYLIDRDTGQLIRKPRFTRLDRSKEFIDTALNLRPEHYYGADDWEVFVPKYPRRVEIEIMQRELG